MQYAGVAFSWPSAGERIAVRDWTRRDKHRPLTATHRWVGEYSSAATGRSGSIVFDLTGDQKTARGEVMMYSSIVNVPADNSHAADVLSISFVRAADDVVTGKLDPYRDPKTSATLTTTFTGRMAGDTIEGTFESLSSDSNVPQRGRWKVKRISGAAP